jgi:hypothetical protein
MHRSCPSSSTQLTQLGLLRARAPPQLIELQTSATHPIETPAGRGQKLFASPSDANQIENENTLSMSTNLHTKKDFFTVRKRKSLSSFQSSEIDPNHIQYLLIEHKTQTHTCAYFISILIYLFLLFFYH